MQLRLDTQAWNCGQCGTFFSPNYLDGWHEGFKAGEERILELEETLCYVRGLGEVYVYPEDWRCAKMGGPPAIENYNKVDLSNL